MDLDPRSSPHSDEAPAHIPRPSADWDISTGAAVADSEPALQTINYRTLMVSVVIVVLAVGGVLGVHRYQLGQLAIEYREMGQSASRRGDAIEAISHLRRYLELAPDDTAAVEQLAHTIEATATEPDERYHALLLFERLIRETPESEPVRRKLISLSIEFGRLSDAARHIRRLLKAQPDDAGLRGQLAEVLEFSHLYEDAADEYERAIVAAPGDLRNYRQLSRLLVEHLEDRFGAESILNDLVANNRGHAEAYLTRASFHLDQGREREARIDAAKAYRIAPDDSATLVRLVTLSAVSPWPDRPATLEELRTKLSRVAETGGDAREAALAMVQIALLQGDLNKADERLSSILADAPDWTRALWIHADLLAFQGNFAASEKLARSLEGRLSGKLSLLRLLDARRAFVAGEWPTAAVRFQRILVSESAPVSLRTQAGLKLAECYRQMGRPVRERQVYQELSQLNPQSVVIAAQLAESSRRAGDLESARRQYGQIKDSPLAMTALAELEIEQQRRRPPSRRRWEKAEAAVVAAERLHNDPLITSTLRGRLALARGDVVGAEKVVKRALRQHPNDESLLRLLLDVSEAKGDDAGLQDILSRLDESVAASSVVRGARIRLAVRQGDTDRLTSETKAVLTLPKQDQGPLLKQLATGWYEVGDWDQSSRCWERASAITPYDLEVMRIGLQLALRRGDDALADRTVEAMRTLEGDTGASWRIADVARRLSRMQSGASDQSGDVRERLELLVEEYPQNAQLRTALADICWLRGDVQQALVHYQTVVDGGFPSQHCILQLSRIHYQRGEYDDVGRLIRRFEQFVETPLVRLGILASVKQDAMAEAIRLALLRTESNEADHRDFIWLGQVHQIDGQDDRAEAAFREATTRAPEEPAVWVALVSLLASAGRTEDVDAVIDQATAAVPEDMVDIMTAQCAEALGDSTIAGRIYDEMAGRPVRTVSHLAATTKFYRESGQVDRVITICRQLLNSESVETPVGVVRVARRMLADCLVEASSYREHQEALTLIRENLKASGEGEGDNIEDRLMEARILAASPLHRDRSDAQRAYESLRGVRPLEFRDAMTLARLHLASGDVAKSNKLAQQIVAASPRQADRLAVAIALMLEGRQPAPVVETWLETLREARPHEWRTQLLQVRWLVAEDRFAEGLEVLQLVDPDDASLEEVDRVTIAVTAGRMASQLDRWGQLTAAEDFADFAEREFRRTLKDADVVRPYVEFLLDRWQVEEAFLVCAEAPDSTAPGTTSVEQLAPLYVRLLRTGQLNDDQTQHARDWLKEQRSGHPELTVLVICHAHALALAGEYRVAIEEYRAALRLAPDHAGVMNELALLLALHDESEEAVPLIDRAIEITGPRASLLDTKATIELVLNRPASAVATAEASNRERPTAISYFHTAAAQHALDRSEAAKQSFRTASRLGLNTQTVHPLERAALRQLQVDLGL